MESTSPKRMELGVVPACCAWDRSSIHLVDRRTFDEERMYEDTIQFLRGI
jgi:hypothetical protein